MVQAFSTNHPNQSFHEPVRQRNVRHRFDFLHIEDTQIALPLNMKAARPKLLINESFLLRTETQIEQLKRVLDGIQGFLDEHPSIESGSSRIRIKTFANAAFELELWAYGKTGDWAQFTAIRQGIMLDIAQIVENAGAHFVAPTRLIYLSAAIEGLQPKAKTATSSD